MASHVTAAPESPNFVSHLFGVFSIFFDPQSAAREIFYRWCWVVPVVLMCIAVLAQTLLTLPTVEHVLLTNPPAGVTPETVPRIMSMQRTFSFIGPIVATVFLLIGALLVFGAASVMEAKAKFGTIFNLVALGSMIRLLDSITSVVIVRAKGDDIASLAVLHPTVGLDLLVTDSTNKLLAGLMNFLSLPTIWAIVMTALTFSYAFKVSKMKGFVATSPYWLMILVLALVGALFGR